MDNPRPSWDSYFLDMTTNVASRSTCLRRQVGCLLVRDKRILATGYNGAPAGMEHCEECLRQTMGIPSGERMEICRAVHAEQNAILQAAKHGVELGPPGLKCYCTFSPCVTCAKLLIQAGVEEIVVKEAYDDPLAISMLAEAGVAITIMGGMSSEVLQVMRQRRDQDGPA